MKKILATLFLLGLVSCKTDVKDSNAKYRNLAGGEGDVLYQEARTVLVNRCFKCHEADGSHNYGSETEASWPNNPEISPGDPEGSQLYDSIAQGRMPADGTTLNPSEQKKIFDWIAAMDGSSTSFGAPQVESSSPAFEAAYGVIYQYCVPCHSASNSNGVSSFEFPSQKGWAESGLIASGSAQNSLLYQRIIDGSMPPEPITKTLSPADVAKIETWLNGFQFDDSGVTPPPPSGGGNTPLTAAQRMTQAQALLSNQLRGRCSNCHSNGAAAGGFSFGNLLNLGASYAEWDAATVTVNGQVLQLFEPGNPDGSRIIQVLRGSGLQPADMPTNPAQAYNAQEIQTLRNWVQMANDP